MKWLFTHKILKRKNDLNYYEKYNADKWRMPRGKGRKKKEPRQGYRMKKSMCLLIFSCFLVSDFFILFYFNNNK